MPSKKPDTLLMVADSERDANILYATRIFVPDPFIYFKHKGKSTAVLSDLEIDRAKKDAHVDEVLSLSSIAKPMQEKLGRPAKFSEVLGKIFRDRKIKSVLVPGSFPHGLAADLQRNGVRCVTEDAPFFPKREFKNDDEIQCVERALRITEAGLAAGIAVMKQARIGKDAALTWKGQPVTSELVRGEINAAIVRQGGLPANTIVAGGEQACDPHERGHGPLFAHKPVIIDVFPRDEASGYYGDMTRTVLRGKASDQLKAQFEAVRDAHDLAITKIKPGGDARAPHTAVNKIFDERGFKTGNESGRHQGFFHSTGHGLGLEIHEQPRLHVFKRKLRPGHILTVEPGLYYPGIGGIRIEDVVLVTKTGYRVLSNFHVEFEV